MEFQREPGRIFALDEQGKVLAEVTFPTGEDGMAEINHTYVDPAFRGKGIANQLLREAAETLRGEGKKARLICSYAVTWFQEHPEYGELVASCRKEQ